MGKKQVAYAVDMGIVKGYPNNILAPNDPLNGKMYCTLILRELGYAVDGPAYHDAPWTLTGIGGLTSAEADRLGEKDLLRDDLVGLSIGALSTVGIDGQRLVDRLIKKGQIDEDAALSLGFVFPTPTPTPAPTATPTPTPTSTPTPTPTVSPDDDDDDNIVGTGVTSSLEYEQGSLGAKEVYRLTVGEAAASGNLLFTMFNESDYQTISHSFFVNPGNAQTVANAVYSSLSDAIIQGNINLGCFGISHENDSVEIIFTADEEDADKNVDIELKEDISDPQVEFFEDAVGEKVTPGMPHVWERVALIIETWAARSGTLELHINGAALDIPVAAGETANAIAERIYNLVRTAINDNPDFSFMEDSYEVDTDGTMIIFTATSPGDMPDLNISLE